MISKLGSGYLNGWNFSNKEKSMPPGADVDTKDTKFVNEKQE